MNPLFYSQDEHTAVSLGMSLIEVLVAVAVITIVAGFSFLEREGFSRSVNLDNVAYEMAQAIRQAQSYGVSSRGSGFGDDVDDFAYAVEFDLSNPQQFILFQDRNGNERYNSTGDNLIETYQLPDRMQIVAICEEVNSAASCSSGSRNDVVILFRRPNPDARFYSDTGSPLPSSRDQITVVIEEDSGAREVILTTSSGYITLK